MGKCLRRSFRQRPSPAVEAAAYLTLRSGRRVPAAAGSGSPTRRRHRRVERCCGKAGAASAGRQRHGRRVLASETGEEEAELPPSQESPVVFCNEDYGGDRRVGVAHHSGEAKRDHHESDAQEVEPRSVSPPPEAEIEAFLAAAELAERRRFMETYNYDIALDHSLEGRFDWSPVPVPVPVVST
uniref:Uncharacterized protein n=1 Tax=Avena sativa TaxID=4498 RepID=A0ACD5X1S7_AVESA